MNPENARLRDSDCLVPARVAVDLERERERERERENAIGEETAGLIK